MTQFRRLGATAVLLAGVLAAPQIARPHGDVTPQPVDTTGLPSLGDKWLTVNPYRGNPTAIKIGEVGYEENCSRCHGLGAVSGGFAPDLRHTDQGADGDEIFISKVRNGVARNGAVYMPKFEGILSQEAMWAIRSWLDTKYKAE